MAVPISQMATVATYLLRQKLRGVERYPLVLMLEPLYRCNLACGGCGKIQYPGRVLRKHLSVEECMAAVDECPAPMVSIPGGEPLLHPEIDKIVEGLVARKKYIYLCTNAILLEEKLDLFTAEQVPLVQRAPRRAARGARRGGVPRRHLRRGGLGDPRRARARLPRHHEHHALRQLRPRTHRAVLRLRDGPRRRGVHGVAGLCLREGARPGALARAPAHGASSSASCCTAPARGAGASTSRRCSSSSSRARTTTSARPGACPPTRSSAGRSPAT